MSLENLVSVSSLDRYGYLSCFGDIKFYLFLNSEIVDFGTSYDGLYMIDLFSQIIYITCISFYISSNTLCLGEI